MRSIEKLISIAIVFAFGFFPILDNIAYADATGHSAINWLSSLDTAGKLAAQSGRPVLIHFWRTDCGPCRTMERTIHTQPNIIAAIESNFIPVKINCKLPEAAPALSHFNIKSVPTEIIVAPNGQVLARIEAAPSNATVYLAALQQGFNAPRANLPNTMVATNSQPPQRQPMQVANNQPQSQPYNAALQQHNVTPQSPPVNMQQPANPYMVASARQETMAPAPMTSPVINTNPRPEQNLPGQVVANSQVPADRDRSNGVGNADPAAQGTENTNSAAPPVGFALDGYCPVILKEKEVWTQGDRRWGANHEGRVYLFAGQKQQQQFLSNPELYAPVLAGFDIVRLVDSGQWIAGWRGFGAFYNDRIFLFTGEESLARFEANPDFYVQSSVKIREEIARRQQASAVR